VGLLDFPGPAAQHFCGILYVGDIAKFPCFCLWQPFGDIACENTLMCVFITNPKKNL
jgi:hypothetical protein